jgi:hypothetical protein
MQGQNILLFFLLGVEWDWVHMVRQPLTVLLYQPRITEDECGAVSRMRIGRGNWSTRRKPAPVPLCPPQIPHDLTWARTRPAVVGSWWLTAWAIKTSHFSSWRRVFLCDVPDWGMKESAYIVMQSHIQLACAPMAPAWWTTGSVASSS